MTELYLRDSNEDDQPTIQELTVAAFHEYAVLGTPEQWEDYRRSILERLTNLEGVEQIVAIQEGTIVGSVLLLPAETTMQPLDNPSMEATWPEIRLLAVRQTSRGQGIGEALVYECIRRARQSGASALTLHTINAMKAAMRLYERTGFAHVVELDSMIAPGITLRSYRYEFDKEAKSA